MKPERRLNSTEEKLQTQKRITYIILALFFVVMLFVMMGNNESLVNVIVQSVIIFTSTAVGYWIGSSKEAATQSPAVFPVTPNALPATTTEVKGDTNA